VKSKSLEQEPVAGGRRENRRMVKVLCLVLVPRSSRVVTTGVMTSTGRPTQKPFYTNAVGAKQVEANLVNLQLHSINVGLVFWCHRRSIELTSSLRGALLAGPAGMPSSWSSFQAATATGIPAS
jgi:hypothetical protein